jgi:hypothetical protein
MFQSKRRSVDNQGASTPHSSTILSGFDTERVFVCDIQKTAKDTSKCKPGWKVTVVAKAKKDKEVKRVKAKDYWAELGSPCAVKGQWRQHHHL